MTVKLKQLNRKRNLDYHTDSESRLNTPKMASDFTIAKLLTTLTVHPLPLSSALVYIYTYLNTYTQMKVFPFTKNRALDYDGGGCRRLNRSEGKAPR